MNEDSVISRASIIGMGNVLLGDDCFGPFTIEVFRSLYECGPGVEIVDVGTPGSDLAPYLYGRDLVIIVDAVRDNGNPGTIRTYREGDFSHYCAQLRLTNHDLALEESLAQLRLVNADPVELMVVGVIPEHCRFGEDISSTLVDASLIAAESLSQLLLQRGFACCKRPHPLTPRFWWMSKSLEKRSHQKSIPVSLNDN